MAVEGAVGDHQRDVALAPRQRQRRVELVVDDPHPGQAAPDVAAPCGRGGGRGTTGTRPVRAARPRPGRRRSVCAAPGRISRSLPDYARREVARDLAVEGERVRARSGPPGWPSYSLRLWPPCRWTVSSPASRGSSMLEGDLGALPGGPPDRRPRKAAAVGPHPGLAAGQHLAPRPRGSGSLDARAAQLLAGSAARRWNGVASDARSGAAPPGRAGAEAAAQRQQRGERAAAQGAEEGSAPQARRGWVWSRSSR